MKLEYFMQRKVILKDFSDTSCLKELLMNEEKRKQKTEGLYALY